MVGKELSHVREVLSQLCKEGSLTHKLSCDVGGL